MPDKAQELSTNAQVGRDDVSGGGTNESDADSKKASSEMAALRNASTSSSLPVEEIRNQSVNPSAAISKNGRQTSHDGLLHIPSEGGVTMHPIETSRDWNTPLENSGETSYDYELQGELLQESRSQRQAATEFCIPHAVSGSGVHWPFSASSPTSANKSGFAVPRPPSGISPPIAGFKRKSPFEWEKSDFLKQQDQKRFARIMSDSAGEETTSPAHNTRSQSDSSTRPRSTRDTSENRPRPPGTDADPTASHTAPSIGRTLSDPSIPMILPPRKVFPIQIGDKLFRLSGASISSDAPSYFSQFFEDQLRQNEGADSVRTLYIDRDPSTFEDISLHLQGYHIEPRDGPHFVKLFADAQFFSLPRLTSQLFASTIYIRIGNEEFQIPRDLFNSPGDSPNYFSLGFSIFFTTPTEVFPGLSQRTLLRPPSILPPSVPNRSARTFADLLHVLKGYPVEVRNEAHRTELLKDARYFHLKGLEQRLIPHQISYNLARKKSEILIRIEDIRQSGVSFVADSAAQSSPSASPESVSSSGTSNGPGWVYYQRPYVDSEAFNLVIEITGDEATFLSIAPGSPSTPTRIGRAKFYRQTLGRVTSLFSVIANKMNLPITQPLGLMMMERGTGVAGLPVSPGNTGVSEELVKVRIGADADVTVDGIKWLVGEDENKEDEDSEMDIDPSEFSRAGKKRKRSGDEDEGEEWIVKKAQWRLRVQPISGGAQQGRTGMEVIMNAVKIEACSSERARNAARAFLA